MDKISLPQSLLSDSPFSQEKNPIWLATSLILHRNLAKYPFPPKMDPSQFQQSSACITAALSQTPLLQSAKFLNAETISALDKEFLFEHFFCLESFQNTFSGQGFVIDEGHRFFAEINLNDHLRMRLIDWEGSWEVGWNSLNQMETALNRELEFAFSPKFGYLTSDRNLCGTGLTIRAFLHVPALIHTKQLEETLIKQREEGVGFSGMKGSTDEFPGDILVIYNSYTLGENEEALLYMIYSTAMKFMAFEKQLRAHLKSGNSIEIKDQISRAFGLLLHSYQLQTKEAIDALSLLKLGITLDWVTGTTSSQLDQLSFQVHRAHLLHHLGDLQLNDFQEIAKRRAEFLHQKMEGISLPFEST